MRIAIQEQELLSKDMAKTLIRASHQDAHEKLFHLGGY